MVRTGAVAVEIDGVVVPTTTLMASGARETVSPLGRVMGAAPGERVWELTMRRKGEEAVGLGMRERVTGGPRLAVGVTVRRVGAPVVAAAAGRVERETVLEPMTAEVAPGERDMGVPETVMAGAPGMRVWEPMRNWDEGLAVRVVGDAPEGEKVRIAGPLLGIGAAAGAGRGMVEDPTTTAEAAGARETGVLLIVTGGAPGMRV